MALAALIVSVGTAFVIVMQLPLIRTLEEPILPLLGGGKLVYTHPGEGFSVTVQPVFERRTITSGTT